MASMLKNIAHKNQSVQINFWLILVTLLGLTNFEILAQSSSYPIQTEDRLQISFWENPELNTQVTVGKDGGIEIPIIGRLTTAGLTIIQLRGKIISQMALYNKLVTQLSIVVLDYGHNRVYLTGQVATPGKYSFEEIPNLWNIILEAGGPLETALLDEVVIVRNAEDGKMITTDLANALRRGKLSELPKILPGDTIHVPGTTETGTAPSPLVKKDEIYILGAVGAPGAHKFESNLNLLEVISKAGGPTADANLKKIKHVSVSHGMTSVIEVNIERYINSSIPIPMPIGAGDTIFIPRRRGISPLVSAVITGLITTTITTTITALLLR